MWDRCKYRRAQWIGMNPLDSFLEQHKVPILQALVMYRGLWLLLFCVLCIFFVRSVSFHIQSSGGRSYPPATTMGK